MNDTLKSRLQANKSEAVMPQAKVSLVSSMAAVYNMEPQAFYKTICNTVMPNPNSTPEQVAAFMAVAHAYSLNPFTREIYAFPAKGGGVQPIVSVDGWCKIINSHPQLDGIVFDENHNADGQLVSVTCTIYRKDRSHPIRATEYLSECRRDTDTWKRWPVRMLRHKALIQTARIAFGFSGIIDEDEAGRYQEAGVIEIPANLPMVEATPPAEPEAVKAEVTVDEAQFVLTGATTGDAWQEGRE